MKVEDPAELMAEIERICMSSGIDYVKFLKEKILELKERRRILLTPSREWYLKHPQKLHDYFSAITDTKPQPLELEILRKRIREFYNPQIRILREDWVIEQLLVEQNHRCAICGVLIEKNTCEIDHKIPIAAGGENEKQNYQLVCRKCNSGKGDALNYAALTAWKTSNKDLREGPALSNMLRYAVLRRDSSRCVNCSSKASEKSLFVRRRIGRRNGGQIVFDNLITLCELYIKEKGSE